MKVRYNILSYDDRKEIDSYVNKMGINYPSLKSFKIDVDRNFSYDENEALLEKYKEFLNMIENDDVFDYLELAEFKRTAPDDVEVWEELDSEIMDYVEEQIEKYETILKNS